MLVSRTACGLSFFCTTCLVSLPRFSFLVTPTSLLTIMLLLLKLLAQHLVVILLAATHVAAQTSEVQRQVSYVGGKYTNITVCTYTT